MSKTDQSRIINASPVPGPAMVAGVTAIGLFAAIYPAIAGPAADLPLPARFFMLFWLAVSILVTLLVTPRHFTAGFLCGLGAMLIGWRVAALYSLWIVTLPLLAAFLVFVAQFAMTMRRDLASQKPVLSVAEWVLAFIRIYIGFDLVPHFTEKLFAGAPPFMADVRAFESLGVVYPQGFVVLGGLCEFAIMVGFGLGLLTRIAAPCAILYYLIATILGGHFLNGFIWAGGGWEYSALMMTLFLPFAVVGAGPFSLDGALAAAGRFPKWLPR